MDNLSVPVLEEPGSDLATFWNDIFQHHMGKEEKQMHSFDWSIDWSIDQYKQLNSFIQDKS